MALHDLVIRGAVVVDGLGHDPIRADVAVRNGRIAAIGEAGTDAAEVVDAGGLALMPGIIDLHTHRAGYLGSDAVALSLAYRPLFQCRRHQRRAANQA
jgi:N-acyl-D-aspartate/D-glutamate deacylase